MPQSCFQLRQHPSHCASTHMHTHTHTYISGEHNSMLLFLPSSSSHLFIHTLCSNGETTRGVVGRAAFEENDTAFRGRLVAAPACLDAARSTATERTLRCIIVIITPFVWCFSKLSSLLVVR